MLTLNTDFTSEITVVAEVCELVGLFILNELIIDKKIYKSNCCLYRDFKKISPRIIDQLKIYNEIISET